MLISSLLSPKVRAPTAMAAPAVHTMPTGKGPMTETLAMRLSAVNRCVEVLSDSMAKLPSYVIDERTHKRVPDHYLLPLLNLRPNEAMTPSVAKKMVEVNRLTGGNGYEWILRDPKTMRPVELIPLPHELVTPWRDLAGHVWYTVQHPLTGEPMKLSGEDVNHFKAYSHDGFKGISVLERAAEVILAGRAAQEYSGAFYAGDANPSGVLKVEGDLQGTVETVDSTGKKVTKRKKDVLREEWERVHAGPKNGHRVAILDYGVSYQPISTSPRDAQFVETLDMSVQDIARFFGVPLYKLQSGKQSYSSNEQNAIEYVTSSLHPVVCQYEEERTWKMLPSAAIHAGMEIRINMMAELKGDFASRASWYKNMREIGAFSVNDIRDLEDLESVPGGDSRYASWNYGPLERWEELSVKRNGGK